MRAAGATGAITGGATWLGAGAVWASAGNAEHQSAPTTMTRRDRATLKTPGRTT